MMARIIDGKAVAERVTAGVRDEVAQRISAGRSAPRLAVVLIGENAASQVYVRNKRKDTHAVRMHAAARRDRRTAGWQARSRHRAVEHRRTSDGARAVDGALHGDDLPFGHVRSSWDCASG